MQFLQLGYTSGPTVWNSNNQLQLRLDITVCIS